MSGPVPSMDVALLSGMLGLAEPSFVPVAMRGCAAEPWAAKSGLVAPSGCVAVGQAALRAIACGGALGKQLQIPPHRAGSE